MGLVRGCLPWLRAAGVVVQVSSIAGQIGDLGFRELGVFDVKQDEGG